MRILSIFTIQFIGIVSLFGQNSEQQFSVNLVFDYDPVCVKTYEYLTDEEYIVEDSYTNYHVKLSENKYFILKVLKSTPAVEIPASKLKHIKHLNCESAQVVVDKWLVTRVNSHGGYQMYISVEENGEKKYYPVYYTILKETTTDFMNYYAPPYFSLYYDYYVEHYPGQPISAPNYGDSRNFDVRFYLHGKTYVDKIRKDVFLKIYNDACHARDLAVTVPLSPVGEVNPYLQKDEHQGKLIFRSCQHAIETEFLRDIGLYREFYQEGTMKYSSQLVSIDGIPIDSVIKYTVPIKKNLIEMIENSDEVFAVNNNMPKGGVIRDSNGNIVRQNDNDINDDTDEDIENMNFGFGNKALSESQEATNPVHSTKNTHTVQPKETLYSISKKYKVSVPDLKKANQLKGNIIYIHQELVIPDKK